MIFIIVHCSGVILSWPKVRYSVVSTVNPGITGHHRGAAQMVLVIKAAAAGCDLGNTLVTSEYILCLLAVGNHKMITDVM